MNSKEREVSKIIIRVEFLTLALMQSLITLQQRTENGYGCLIGAWVKVNFGSSLINKSANNKVSSIRFLSSGHDSDYSSPLA